MGQHAIFCAGTCQAWRDRCANLMKVVFESLVDLSTDYFCPTCRLTTLESMIHDIKTQ